METIQLPHLPESHSLHAILFQNVENAVFLRQQLLDGNADFEYAFLDASVLLSRKHVLAACWRAVNDSLQSRLKTRNVHSEIVFALSTNNNVKTSPSLLPADADTDAFPDSRVFPPLRHFRGQ